jgi:hypothetical protein
MGREGFMAELEDGLAHLDLGLGEPVLLSDEADSEEWVDGVKPDAGSQNPAAHSDAGDSHSDEAGEPPFAGGAGEGDDLPTSGVR